MVNTKMDLSIKENAEMSKNTTVLVDTLVLNLVISVAYLVELLKGTRTIGSYLLVAALCLVPTILSYVEYHRKKDSGLMRYISSIGFLLLYTYVMFTTTTDLSFCYILVFFVVIIVYSDIKLSVILTCVALGVNLIVIVQKLITGTLKGTALTNAEIIIFCVLLTCIFALMSINRIAQINEASNNKAEEEKKQSEELLQAVLKMSDTITANIESAVAGTIQLKDSSVATQHAMDNLADGTNDAVSAIVAQKESTEQIDIHIHEVEEAVATIMTQIHNTEANIEAGNAVMKELLQQVQISESSGEMVAEKMTELSEYANKMQDIMGLISSVAYQTGMLALNASIEAARAGEAGRGFAVVASQISNLAAQTNSATSDINQLIDNISHSVAAVSDSMNTLLESSRLQNKYVDDTAGNMEKIQGSTQEIVEQTEQLEKIVDVVVDANTQVIERIVNVSELIEEVTASASETLESSNKNLDTIEKVSIIMEKLGEEGKELQKTYQI